MLQVESLKGDAADRRGGGVLDRCSAMGEYDKTAKY